MYSYTNCPSNVRIFFLLEVRLDNNKKMNFTCLKKAKVHLKEFMEKKKKNLINLFLVH